MLHVLQQSRSSWSLCLWHMRIPRGRACLRSLSSEAGCNSWCLLLLMLFLAWCAPLLTFYPSFTAGDLEVKGGEINQINAADSSLFLGLCHAVCCSLTAPMVLT